MATVCSSRLAIRRYSSFCASLSTGNQQKFLSHLSREIFIGVLAFLIGNYALGSWLHFNAPHADSPIFERTCEVCPESSTIELMCNWSHFHVQELACNGSNKMWIHEIPASNRRKLLSNWGTSTHLHTLRVFARAEERGGNCGLRLWYIMTKKAILGARSWSSSRFSFACTDDQSFLGDSSRQSSKSSEFVS